MTNRLKEFTFESTNRLKDFPSNRLKDFKTPEPVGAVSVLEAPSTIQAEPVPQIDITEQQELEQRNALYKYMREHPEFVRNLQHQNENKVIQDYFTGLPEPKSDWHANQREARKRWSLGGSDNNYWRKTYLAKAKRAQIKRLQEQGLIPDERREYEGFWDELGRNTAGGSLNVASGLIGTLASVSEGAIWDKDKLEQWAQKLHEKSAKPAYTAAKEGGWKGFVAASVGQAIPYMGAATASVLVTGQPYAAFGIGFSVEGDNAYRDALDAGATEEQAQMNRFVVGTINGVIEQIQISRVFKFARAGKGSVRAVSKLAQQKAMKKIAQKGGKLTLEAFQHSAREALEEALQETTSIAAEARINPEAWNNATERILRSGAGGGVVGLGFGSAGRIVSRMPGRAERLPSIEQVREGLIQDYFAKIEKEGLRKPIPPPAGLSPAIAKRAAEMLKEGWTSAEIDQYLISPSKFLGDKAIDQPQAKERPRTWEQIKADRQQEAAIAEMDRELAAIQRGETPSTRGIAAPTEAVAGRKVVEGVKTPPGAEIAQPEAVGVAQEAKLTAQQEGMKAEALRTAEREGIEVTPAGNLVLYHGTRSAQKIRESGSLPIGTYFAAEKTIAKRFAEQAQQKGKAEVIQVEVPAHKIFTSGGEELYFSANEPITLAQPPTEAKAPTIEELQAEKDISDEELSGITKRERRRLIKENAAKIEGSDIYQNEVAGLEVSAREVGPGYYYIDKGYRGEVEAIIGKRKGFPTKIQRMFTFDPTETRIITLPTGEKAEVGPQSWESAVQEGLGRGKEGVAQTWGEMDISEFVQRVVDSYQQQETIGGINKQAIEKAEQSGHPDMQLWAEKQRMLAAGMSDHDINEMVTEWAEEWGIDLADIEGEFINEYGTKLRQIKRMEDPDAALEQLATEQIEAEDRQAAADAARDVLETNDITAEVEEVDEIEYDDEVPFEKRERPVGAAITQGQKQVILLAYGADSETGYHEGYHILRRRLTDKDTKVLDKYFKGDEEAEATAFAEYVKTGKARTILRGIWQRLRNVLRKVKSGLTGKGFRTAEDIFKGIQTGRIEKIPARAGVAYETSSEKLRREAEKSARIKARKARLAAQAGIPKRRRGRQAPRIKIKLQDHTPPLRADLAPLPREAAEERPLKTKTLTRPVYTEKWFEENLKREKRRIFDKADSEARRAWMGLEKVFSSSSTRLYNIVPKLFRATRRYIYDVLIRSTEMTQDVSDFVKATRKMSKDDWRQLDLALKNGIDWKTDQLVAKYNLTEQFQKTRAVLDEIYDAAKEVGIDIDYRKNYWPRVLKDPEGFLMYFQGREDWSIIEQAIKRRAEQAGRKIEDLTDDEKAHVVNTLLRGYRTQALTLSRPGPAKERTVESIDKKLDAFYDDSKTALHKYIKLMNAKIAEREFFGRETKELQNLRKTQSARLTRLLKLKRRVGLKYPSEPAYKEHISKTAQAWKEGQERLARLKARPLSETIGGYVMRLQAEGEISPTQEKEIQNILTGIFDPQRMGSRMGVFATGVYIDTLNSPLQALTQLDEFAYSFYRSPLRSIPVAIRTAVRKSKITPRDIGITSIGEEFQGPSMKRALSLLLKSTGFEMIDRLNKENYINTVLSKYQSQAKRKNLNATFVKRLSKVFGDDYKGVIEDLRNNRISDNVKYLLFNEILDIQPIAITEMPEAYNKAGNMRILYALKTFYMKRLDFIRNECFKDMKSKKTFARGFGKLVWLAGAFALMGAGSDALKDFIRGKVFDLEDSIADNLLRMAFFSKYQAWRTREKGLGTAVLEGWRPPTKAIDALTRDIINEAQGKERGWELWRSVPIAGEEYYWWFGEGRKKIERKEGKKSSWY